MTMKYKIISGFLFMILLVGAVAFVGHRDIQKASDGFDEYRRLARFNVNASDMETAVYVSAYKIYQFFETLKTAEADAARTALDNAVNMLKEAQQYVRKPERHTIMQNMLKEMASFREQLDTLEKQVTGAYDQYSKEVQPNMLTIQENLKALASQAKGVGNLDALEGISNALQSLALARSALSRFAGTRRAQDATLTRGYLAEVATSFKNLESSLKTAEGRKLFESLNKAFIVASTTFVSMENASKLAEQAANSLNATLSNLSRELTELNSGVHKDMNAQGSAMLQSNALAQKQMLSVSGAGLLLGAVFALLIIYGLIRVLSQLGAFANAVAKGDFSYQITIREKGEIGNMIQSMKQIPTVLERVMQEGNVLADVILSGQFRNRLEPQAFSGAFADLAKAVNIVGDAYTKVLDSLLIPIMSCDKKNNILFLNSIAQTIIGGNFVNSPCREHFKAAECGKEGCLGACAMAQNDQHSGETIIYPQGKRMEVAVTAIPLHNAHNETVGYMEFILDLTEAKARQALMQRVAREASEISDRVAAASEELAAQVEEVSHGAEMQRTRVESTASAMGEMNSTVLEVARSAGQASEQSEGTRQKAADGANLVNKVVNAINMVNAVAAKLQDNMQELGKQAESIGGVMNVISDIADQTNLLALNAAIEAARAGEAGRGFAVVADEVRKLAEKTMTATQEVGSSISAIQHSAKSNINEVGHAVTNINEATVLANSSGVALKEIVDLAAANSSVVTSIATAAEEQSATSEEINRAIEEINRIVAETTDGMVQSSAAVRDLSHMAQELRHVMEGLK